MCFSHGVILDIDDETYAAATADSLPYGCWDSQEFETEAAAVAEANDSPYGLAGAVLSTDEARCERIARSLRAGIVWKNCAQPTFIQAPWGGFKKSGFGRELGRWGLEEYTGVKQITSCAPGFQWGLW